MRKRNKFSLSHYKLMTCKFGLIYPVACFEVLPGDTIRMATSAFVRVAPMLAPVMHPVHVSIHHWFVPTRLLWDKFEDFITGGPDGLDVSVPPTCYRLGNDVSFSVGSLADYLGVGQVSDRSNTDTLAISALPFRAYNLIFNEWYRDQDLIPPVKFSTASGTANASSDSFTLLRSSWERDIFTTSRPWPQKGLAVDVPVNPPSGGSAPSFSITGDVTASLYPLKPIGSNNPAARFETNNGFTTWTSSLADQNPNPYDSNAGLGINVDSSNLGVSYTPGSGASGLGSVNINDLREAFALQKFEEHRAMYGSRYTEYLRYLGVRSSDARLQRPEYLGGGRQTIQFSEVLQTDPSDSSPAGTLKGHGIGAMRTPRFRRFIEEHGFIMSLMVIRPKAIYSNGTPRMFLRRTKEDYYQKELEHIGQQAVYNREIYDKIPADDISSDFGGGIFGYQNRYDDYRQHWSSIAGEFHNIFNYWHLARQFASKPALNGDFISCNPSPRIFAAQENDHFYCMINHSIQARRLLSKFGNPI